MADADIAQQTLVEHGMLKHITDALRLAIGWELKDGDVQRKLSTVRFIARCLQRHLEHLFALEEHDGYMDAVLRHGPHLSKRVSALRQEHDQFRQALPRLVGRLEQLSPTDPMALGSVCDDLLALLQRLDEHSRQEANLLQEALAREGGGEG
jgi:hemerythrin-like domain-containing protein